VVVVLRVKRIGRTTVEKRMVGGFGESDECSKVTRGCCHSATGVFYTKKIVVALQWWACRNPDGDHSTVINWSTLNEHPGHRPTAACPAD